MRPSLSTPGSKESVLSAALTVLRRDGASGLRVRSVAMEAGCSTTGIYTHFGNKNGLVEAIYVDGFERFDEALDTAPTTGTPLEQLHARGLQYRTWALANPTSYMVMFGGSVPEFEPGPEATARGLQSFGDLIDSVAAAIDSGELAPGDPTAVAYHLWATIHGYVMLELAQMHRSRPGEGDVIYAAGLIRLIDGLAQPHPAHQ